VDKDGNPKGNFEPGIDIQAKLTILGEGVRGSLCKQLIPRLGLDADSHPQVYALGIKELWQMPPGTVPAGRVIHTLGWPLRDDCYGGSFIYTMADDIVDVGLVVGLDYKDPNLEPHALFNRFKTHPQIRRLIEGGKMIQYGAKALPLGGFHTIPRPYADGVLIIGDSASFLNPMRLKGIHTAMKTGMLAAETAFHALVEDDVSADALSLFHTKVSGSWVHDELRSARNFHAGFRFGTLGGIVNSALILMTGGEGIFGKGPGKAGHEIMQTVDHYVDHQGLGDEAREFRRFKPDGGVQQPLHALLPGAGLQHRGRRGGSAGHAPADRFLQLRALQDLRHHGSVPGHHLGSSRGWGRTALRSSLRLNPAPAASR
jgi:electron-transferring-flavoprotein dehydrogenase